MKYSCIACTVVSYPQPEEIDNVIGICGPCQQKLDAGSAVLEMEEGMVLVRNRTRRPDEVWGAKCQGMEHLCLAETISEAVKIAKQECDDLTSRLAEKIKLDKS